MNKKELLNSVRSKIELYLKSNVKEKPVRPSQLQNNNIKLENSKIDQIEKSIKDFSEYFDDDTKKESVKLELTKEEKQKEPTEEFDSFDDDEFDDLI